MNGSDLGVRSLNPRAGCRDCLMTTNKPSVHSCRSAGGLHARHRDRPPYYSEGSAGSQLDGFVFIWLNILYYKYSNKT